MLFITLFIIYFEFIGQLLLLLVILIILKIIIIRVCIIKDRREIKNERVEEK